MTHATTEAALGAVIENIGTAHFIEAMIDYLRQLADFGGCFLVMIEDSRRIHHVYDNVRNDRRIPVIDRYFDGAYLLDPFFVYCQAFSPTDVLRLDDVAPDRFHQSTYFETYYSTLRLSDELAIFIDLGQRRNLFWSLGRMLDEPVFDAANVAILKRNMPVLRALCLRHFSRQPISPFPSQSEAPDIDGAMTEFAANLTGREREIAALILKGHSTGSIALTTGITAGTVKIHRKNLYRKLGISSQGELYHLFLHKTARLIRGA
ncbi:helix-turn-helix transcriptional regulator [Martelella sp. HB161492]|uniref:LuxR C-terminal-related transcriptional regulator n=1 Tax=Martelella sp. HB161492 TaxID=2720726 RepID=UPI0015916B05